jgi:hypothetical protein
MIGWWTNAADNINLMNWTGKTGPYARMWTLPQKRKALSTAGGITDRSIPGTNGHRYASAPA